MKAGHFSAKIPGQISAEINIVCNKGDEEAAMELVKSRGFDPDNDSHYLILRSLVNCS